MPSPYAKWCRDDPFDASMRNLAKAPEQSEISPTAALAKPRRKRHDQATRVLVVHLPRSQ